MGNKIDTIRGTSTCPIPKIAQEFTHESDKQEFVLSECEFKGKNLWGNQVELQMLRPGKEYILEIHAPLKARHIVEPRIGLQGCSEDKLFWLYFMRKGRVLLFSYSESLIVSTTWVCVPSLMYQGVRHESLFQAQIWRHAFKHVWQCKSTRNVADLSMPGSILR